jgi:hypothetical protein
VQEEEAQEARSLGEEEEVQEEEEEVAGMPLRLAVAALLILAVAAPGAEAATITPTVATDDLTSNGNCTLREAVLAADGNSTVDQCQAGDAAAPDSIVLLAPLYNLTLSGANEDSNLTGDLDVFLAPAGPLTIEGKSDAGPSEIDGTSGANSDRVIDVKTTSASSLTLAEVRLDDGNPPAGNGGALRVPGLNSVTLDSSSVTNSSSTSSGGGMQVAGDLTLNRSTVSGNASTKTTGAVGAGIFSGGDLSLDSSTVSGNHVDSPDDTASDDVRGGGIAAQAGSIEIVGSTIAGNAVHALDSSDTSGGGGIYAENVPVTITNSIVSGNAVDQVGGISVAGGLFYSDLAPLDGFLKVQNSTFSGNSSQLEGGAMQVFDGVSGVKSSTFSGNVSGGAKAIFYDDFADAVSSLSVGGSILSEGGTGECDGPDALNSFGFNIDRGTSCGLAGTGDLQNTNAGLLGLAANGGPTQTRALPAGSPALDRIPAASCTQIDTTPLTADQRGAPRGFDEDGDGIAECDVGAYELNRCQGKVVDLLGSNGISGTSAANVILGSGGSDQIDPGQGNDTICAGDGDDDVFERPNGGSDSVDGGAGPDTVFLGVAPPASSAGTVDLSAGTASATGMTASLSSFENASGSPAADTVIGDDGPNTLDGGIGADTITGGGGPDTLLGGNDDDQLLARDGIGDTVDCGPGEADSAQADQLSLDAVSSCESVDALAEPVIASPPDSTTVPPPGAPLATAKKCKKKHKRRAATAKRKRCKKRRKK